MSADPLWAMAAALLALTALSAFFTATGTSLLALHRQRLKRLQAAGDRRARRVRRLLKRSDRLVGALGVGNQLTTMFSAVLAATIGWRLLGISGGLIALLLLTILQLVFAEALPKRLATRRAESIALGTSVFTQITVKILYPIAWLVNAVATQLLQRTGATVQRNGRPLDVVELRALAAETGQLMADSQQAMLLRILELEQLTVEDVMIPRAAIVGVDLNAAPETIEKLLRHCKHTQLPTFRDDLDAVAGFLHLRTMGQLLDAGGRLDRTRLERQLLPAYFVPEGTPLQTQLLNFQRQKRRLALVVDEYGSVLGLLTLEDVLEQVVRVIGTNDQGRSDAIVSQDDGGWVIDGAANLRELNRHLNWDLDLDGPRTLSGLLLEHLEAFPDGPLGVRLGPYGFEVLDMEGRKIKRVRAFNVS